MFFKNKNKGAVSLFTGIAVLFVSIIFLGIFTYFAMGYFGGLEDSQRMKNNRNSLSLINEMLLEIKDSGNESYRAITLNTSDPITIDHNSSKITLTQEIKNQRSIERLKTETKIGALTINKRETSIVYTLDYNGQLLFYNTMDIMPVKQKIIFEKINEVNGIPVISISTEQLSFEGTKIYSHIENITYSLGEAIEFKGIVTNTLEDYNCEWVSNIDGMLTEQCNYVVEEISQGEHEITFTAKIEEEVIATKKINIIVGSTTVVPLFSMNILTPSNNYSLDQGEEISFTSQVNNPVGSYSCAWSSSLDGNLSSDCNFSSTSLSVGSHTITLTVTDENETKTKNISLIVNQSIFTNVSNLSPGSHTITLSVTDENQTLDTNISILVLSDGSSAESAAPSAMYIKNNYPSSTSGVYWILKNGVPTQIYCDMENDGGGWMLYSSFSTDNTYSSSYPAWNGNRILTTNLSTYGYVLDYYTHYTDGVNSYFATYTRRPEFLSFFYSGPADRGLLTMNNWNGPSDVNQLRVYYGLGSTAASYSSNSGNLIINNSTVVTGTSGDFTSTNVSSFDPDGATPLLRVEEVGIAGISWIFMR